MTNTLAFFLAIVFCVGTPAALSQQKRELAAETKLSADFAEEKWELDPIAFNAGDRAAIRNYYREFGSTSAQTKGRLPARLQKQLRRNIALAPGLQRHFQPLADDLEQVLQPLYSGYARGAIGRDIVLVEGRTQRVMDIIRDVTVRR